jgi:hypothetical protein
VVTGFNCATNDTHWFETNGYDLITARTYNKIHDWVPDHDFVPFIPGNGKVLGVPFGNNQFFPFYDHRRASYAVPYIKPFGPTHKWANIPEENVGQLSVRCLNVAIQLFKELENKNPDREIRIGDLLKTRQRTSVPMMLESTNFPLLSAKVSSYLKDCL